MSCGPRASAGRGVWLFQQAGMQIDHACNVWAPSYDSQPDRTRDLECAGARYLQATHAVRLSLLPLHEHWHAEDERRGVPRLLGLRLQR